jgi:hypothetical protein
VKAAREEAPPTGPTSSSTSRAGGGHARDPAQAHDAAIPEPPWLGYATNYGSKGWGFESLRAHPPLRQYRNSALAQPGDALFSFAPYPNALPSALSRFFGVAVRAWDVYFRSFYGRFTTASMKVYAHVLDEIDQDLLWLSLSRQGATAE